MSTDDNSSFELWDTSEILEELAKRASRYSINLVGLVYKDNIYCLRGGCATVSSGIFQPREEVLIGGTGLAGNSKGIKVSLCSIVPYLISDGRETRWL